jgi:glycosyltransferase involved in cell wall biosynthesis
MDCASLGLRSRGGSAPVSAAPLTVLSVAFPLAPVGPDAVGGAEQVLTQLDTALVRRGHRSLVIACEGSVTAGTLIPLERSDPRDDRVWYDAHDRCRDAIRTALACWPVDLVHLHGVDFSAYAPHGVPTLATLHLPPTWYPAEVFETGGTFRLNCVSASQRAACPPMLEPIRVIENGVPLPAPTLRSRKREFALALGRICPEKGFHLALDAARRASMPLMLAGSVLDFPAHRRYFDREIVPRLDRLRRFIGPVGLRRKQRLLAAATCLVVSSLVPETSSLVAMEAMTCGTPVVAFETGALAELVTPGQTGFLVHSQAELASAMREAAALDPDKCRKTACLRFSAERMADEYLALYATLAGRAERTAARISAAPP